MVLLVVIIDQETIKLVDSLLGISLLIMIKLSRSREPLPRLDILATMEQCVGVRVPQSSQCLLRHGCRPCRSNRTLQQSSRLIGLAEVAPRTRLDDDHLDAQRRIQSNAV